MVHITFWETSNEQFCAKFWLYRWVGLMSLLKCISPSMMLCARIGWNWPSGSLNVFNVHYFLYSLLENSVAHHFEQTWISFTTGCSVSNINGISPVVIKKKIFECRQAFSLLGKNIFFISSMYISFERTDIPYTQRCFGPYLVEIDLANK